LELSKSNKKVKKASAPRRGGRRGGNRQAILNDEDSDVSYESDNGQPHPAQNIINNSNFFLRQAPFVCMECQNQSRFLKGFNKIYENLGISDGFKCGRNQIHFYCMSCRSPFPDRSGANYKQKCEICNIPYCNLYFDCKSNRNPKVIYL